MKPTNSFISQSVNFKDKSPINKHKYKAKSIKDQNITQIKNISPKTPLKNIDESPTINFEDSDFKFKSLMSKTNLAISHSNRLSDKNADTTILYSPNDKDYKQLDLTLSETRQSTKRDTNPKVSLTDESNISIKKESKDLKH